MKRIIHDEGARDRLLHVETAGGIVNIRVGLSDSDGRPVTSIQILPDEGWELDGTRLIGKAE